MNNAPNARRMDMTEMATTWVVMTTAVPTVSAVVGLILVLVGAFLIGFSAARMMMRRLIGPRSKASTNPYNIEVYRRKSAASTATRKRK